MFIRAFLILIISLFSFSVLKTEALTDNSFISTAEKRLFSTEYKNDTTVNRLNRIELIIFGHKKAGTEQQRIQAIKNVLGSLEPKKSKNPAINTPIKVIKPTQNIKPSPMENYPVIDEIEKKILNKNFLNDNVYSRLDRLEIAIFNHKFSEPLNVRTERLRATVHGMKDLQEQKSSSTVPALSLNDENIKSILTRLEKETFKTSYEVEPVESRVARLENSVFNEISPEDNIEDRVNRLAAVISAQPSNELYKDMSKLRQYQTATQQLTAAALLIMLIKGLLF